MAWYQVAKEADHNILSSINLVHVGGRPDFNKPILESNNSHLSTITQERLPSTYKNEVEHSKNYKLNYSFLYKKVFKG